jgi:hypothetical protein
MTALFVAFQLFHQGIHPFYIVDSSTKKYISSNIKISKILATLSTFFCSALLAREFSMRIPLFD